MKPSSNDIILQMPEQQRLPVLDLFRVFICLMVFLFHCAIHGVWKISPQAEFLYTNIRTGAVYMDAFFLLSGFVLFYLYGKQEFSTKKVLKEFYLKRFIRCYPLYAFYTVLFCILYQSFDAKLIPMQIFTLQGFFTQFFNTMGNDGTWFISCILISYIAFPVFCYLLNNINKKAHFLILIVSFALIAYLNILSAYYSIKIYPLALYRIITFFIGMIVAHFFIQNRHKGKQYTIPIFIASAILFSGITILYKNNFFNHMRFANNYTFYSCLTVPIFSYLIYALAHVNTGFISRFSSSAFVQHLSNISFSFFLMQGISLYVVKNYLMPHDVGLYTLWHLLLSYLIALFSWTCIEKLATKYLSKALLQRKQIEGNL